MDRDIEMYLSLYPFEFVAAYVVPRCSSFVYVQYFYNVFL